MTKVNLGIIGGGQLGSLLAMAAKKLNIKTTIFSDDEEAPAKNYCDYFIFGNYQNDEQIYNFIEKVDVVTFEFENIPYDTLKKINLKKKYTLIQKLIRLYKIDFLKKISLIN